VRPEDDLRRVLGAAARGQAERLGVDEALVDELAAHLPLLTAADRAHRSFDAERRPVGADDHSGDPAALGELHQSLLDDDHRHRRGVHYTPRAVADRLVARVLGARDRGDPARPARDGPPLVCDPSCGGGVVLLAAAEHLRRAGGEPVVVLERCVRGLDIDPLAVEVARTALVLWAAAHGTTGARLVAAAAAVEAGVHTGDALAGSWPDEGRVGAVLGNPPFAGQLARSTARDAVAARAARTLLGAAAGYADTAGLFLLRALDAVEPGGRVALLQPLSFLGARDAGAVRRRLEERAELEEVWLPGHRVFGAAVDVCVPVLRKAEPFASPGGSRPVAVRHGAGAEAVAEVARDRLARAGSWSPVVAAATGVPSVELGGRTRLGERARATAGFRDEYYALVPFVADLTAGEPVRPPAPLPELPFGHARLVTAGLVDPGHVSWGRRATRFGGRRHGTPVVDVRALRAWAHGPDGDRRLAAWADARLRPKVVVATQTRVVEAAVDGTGSWWPSVPVISVVADGEDGDGLDPWLVAAALTAPPVSAWAAERTGGTALAAGALKLSARQVAEVPLPVDLEAWTAGARELRRSAAAAAAGDAEVAARSLLEAGRRLTAAHGLPEPVAREVLRWWASRAGCHPEI
jgi:hypothetical protein